MSRPTFRTLSTTVEISNTGLSPTMVKLPSLFFYLNSYYVQAPPRSLATTCGISVDFFSSGYLDQFSGFASLSLCIQLRILHRMRWVSPFGHRGIIALLPAPPRFSQAYTSFVAYHRQGIHLMHTNSGSTLVV